MAERGDRNDRYRARLVLELAGGKTQAEAAQAARVSPRTVFRRLQDPEFRREVQERRGELLDTTMGLLADGSAKAVTTLVALLDEGDCPTVRCSAARGLLDHARLWREHLDLAERLAALEAAAKDTEAA